MTLIPSTTNKLYCHNKQCHYNYTSETHFWQQDYFHHQLWKYYNRPKTTKEILTYSFQEDYICHNKDLHSDMNSFHPTRLYLHNKDLRGDFNPFLPICRTKAAKETLTHSFQQDFIRTIKTVIMTLTCSFQQEWFSQHTMAAKIPMVTANHSSQQNLTCLTCGTSISTSRNSFLTKLNVANNNLHDAHVTEHT